MCNIAGYIGKKQAAPILAEMMKREEGFDGGFYTGITTHDGKKLHTAKVVGNMDNLLSETDAIHLPGTTGFLHSRSNAGGDLQWGQPFLSSSGSLSYIANGTEGCMVTPEIWEDRKAVASDLERRGYQFRSKVHRSMGSYMTLEDNSSIHNSEFMAQYIASLVDEEGLSVDAAMSQCMTRFPTEIVAFVLHDKHPDRIFVSRINFPMMIGIADDGDTYLASTALAFPQDVNFRIIEALPPATTFEVFHGGYRASGHAMTMRPVQPITPDVWQRAYKVIEAILQGQKHSPMGLRALAHLFDSLWPAGKLNQRYMLVYEVLRAFQNQGRLHIVKCPTAGAFDGYTMEKFNVYID